MDSSFQPLLARLDHLSDQFRELKEGVQKAVRIADEDPEMALTRARKVLEFVIREVYERNCHEPPGTQPLEGLVQRLFQNDALPPLVKTYATGIRELGNIGTHKSRITVTGADVGISLSQLVSVVEWYAEGAPGNPEPAKKAPARSLASEPPRKPSAIVFKGLRSFDAGDAKFFLDLLPGSRDEKDLPESLRFWKHRIETSQELTFTVGVIYGPSGCGKSSLVKAGLLPRLGDRILSVYVEATAVDTEARLVRGLRKRCPNLPSDLSLTATLAALREGRFLHKAQKILFVLDQFEQWLHAKRGKEDTELVQALRQCDGEHIQCVVTVRDDFWLAVSRFMSDVNIELLQGQNAALVDLFDMIHARNVLSAFGRAFGRLEQNLTKEQDSFLDQAVQGLAQDGRVICVRLALFAEMMKGKPWTPATLKEVGGTEGVGVTFLEETFSSATAPPEHRYHQKAARAVLKSLLHESGTDIKGHMRSHAELMEASGYANRPKDFDDLLRILDSEIRLLTPTDPEGKEGDCSSQVDAGAKYYQLTHDYLVHSLRDWLTRKQKETRRGRAELLLADRAVVWNARPENRQLPSLLQWFQIKGFTQKRNWTPLQKKMMRKATRYHAVRGLIVAVLIAVVTFTGLTIQGQVVQQHKATEATGLVQRLLDANIAQVPGIVSEIEPYRRWADPLLGDAYGDAEKAGRAAGKEAEKTKQASRQLHASLALLPVDATQVDYLYDRLLKAAPSEVPVIRDALVPHKDALLDKLWKVAETPQKGKESQRLRAASALAKYDPETEKWAKVQWAVANDLVTVPAVYLATWMDSLRPVRVKLLAPLSAVYREASSGQVERSQATDILADYAADHPRVLADLVMYADEKQFGIIYSKFKEQGQRGLPVLTGEIDKKVVAPKEKMIFESKGTIAEDDAKVKTQSGSLPSKRFEVPLQGGKTYRLTMDSHELDSFLVLQDKTGKELAFDDDSGGDLNSLLMYTPSSDDTYTVFAASFPNPKVKNVGAFVLKVMETVSGDGGKEKLAKRQANAAVALLKMNQPEKVWPLLQHSPDPRVRSYLIHRLAPLGADAKVIIKRLDEEPDVTIRRALILSLGEFDPDSIAERQVLVARLIQTYREATDAGLHGAAEWLLRHWKQDDKLKEIDEELKKEREQRIERIREYLANRDGSSPGANPVNDAKWYVNGEGQTIVVVPGPVTFQIGSPPTEEGRQGGAEGPNEKQVKRQIDRSFAIAAKAVTVEEFQRFRKGHNYNKVCSNKPNCPMNSVTWFDAVAYCNWLSAREGLEPVYEPNKDNKYGPGMKVKAKYLQLSGYRLPTESEWEYACRAEAVTSRYYGETAEVLGKYAWYTKNSLDRWMLPVGSLKPNDLGLFDMLGNALQWCEDQALLYSAGEDKEDKYDINNINIANLRVLRGGSYFNPALAVRSAYRNLNVPTDLLVANGLRPARTFAP